MSTQHHSQMAVNTALMGGTGEIHQTQRVRPVSATAAAERRPTAPLLLSAPAAGDRYLLPAGRSAANPPATDQHDRQRDGQTDARPLHRPCSAYYAGSVNNIRVAARKRHYDASTATVKKINYRVF